MKRWVCSLLITGLLAASAGVGHAVGAEPLAPMQRGIAVHFTGKQPDVEMIAKAGFTVVRNDLFWNQIERHKGQYDFQQYDELHESLLEHGLRPMYILDYSNALYEEEHSIVTEEGRAAFVRYVREAVSRYKNAGVIWEIWNEPNHPMFWKQKDGQPGWDHYAKLVAAVAPVIREIDPSATVLTPSAAQKHRTDDLDVEWLDKAFGRGILEHSDAVSIHPYTGFAPEVVTEEYRQLRSLIAKHSSKPLQVVSGEWGYSIKPGWSGQRLSLLDQAQRNVRATLLNDMNGVPLHVWYEWRDLSGDGFGIVDRNMRPRPAYQAAKTMNEQLAGFVFEARVPLLSEQDYLLRYTNEKGEKAYAFWTADKAHDVVLPLSSFVGTMTTMDGRKSPVRGEASHLKVRIEPSPAYLRLPDTWKPLVPRNEYRR
jgi:hypothetical protein